MSLVIRIEDSVDINEVYNYKYVVNVNTNITHLVSHATAELTQEATKDFFERKIEAPYIDIEIRHIFCNHGDFVYRSYWHESDYVVRTQPTIRMCKTCVKVFAMKKADHVGGEREVS